MSQSLFFAVVSLWNAMPTLAATNDPMLDAHRFESSPEQMSTSGRIYRFKMKTADVPLVGNIVLLEEQNQPTMAFRVITSDPDKMEYVAQRVRKYDDREFLRLHYFYHSLEKGSKDESLEPSAPVDTTPIERAPIEPSLDQFETAAVQQEKLPTPALAPAQAPAQAPPPGDGLDEVEPDAPQSYEVQIFKRLDPFWRMISLQPGVFRNASGPILGGETFPGLSASFSFKLKDDWILKNKANSAQDSIWMELGFVYYSYANATNDVYTVVPLKAELRWEINLSSVFALQFYGGLQYNWLAATSNVNLNIAYELQTTQILSGLQINVGTGLILDIGPQWYIRSDLGYDRATVGLGTRW